MRATMLAGLAFTAVTVGCSTAMAQSAEDFSYSYFGGGLSVADIDVGFASETETGFNLVGSLDLARGFYVHGSWDRWNTEFGFLGNNVDADIDVYNVGLGYRLSVQESTDLFFEASYAAVEVGSFRDDGFRGDVGLRHGFTRRLEGRVFGGVQTDGDVGDAILGADLLFKTTEVLGLSIGFETYEFDLDIYRANLRLSF